MKIDFKHYQSAHCENGVTSNILKFYGINLSEAMIFGIGSGMFFSYMPFIKVNGMPVISFRPLPGLIFKRAAKRMGIVFKRKKYSNQEKAMKELDEALESGRPVGLQIGVYHLVYFPVPYRMHFNAHNCIVFGKEGNTYHISDPIMETATTLTSEELQRVRFAQGVFAPRGQMYYPVSIPKTEFDHKAAILKGIKKTCSEMLTIPIPLFGAKGIIALSKAIRKWPVKYNNKKASAFLGQVIRAQEEIGTGGAGFRFMYAAFLQEASKELNNPELWNLSQEMTAIGDEWRQFAVMASRICKDRAGDEESYSSVADKLKSIGESEIEFFKKLKKAIEL
jgi:hypothetical protein